MIITTKVYFQVSVETDKDSPGMLRNYFRESRYSTRITNSNAAEF